ncbi:hypothetical protein RvY_00425 [Ramazzottius varieornatus]|uniref:ETS domain-containing protein n=1 Tax=Ramazzottius varieornatus TaxID=947166 RepID=A0A1D1UGD7_RAMVA|nr:hypothetical protein RvY_00425 [Ramazzottius varieornatus]
MPETSRFLRCYRSNSGNTRYSSNASLLKSPLTDSFFSTPDKFSGGKSPLPSFPDYSGVRQESEFSLKFSGISNISQNNPSEIPPAPPSYRDGSKAYSTGKRSYDDDCIVSSVSSPKSDRSSPSQVPNFSSDDPDGSNGGEGGVKRFKEQNKDVSFDADVDVVEFFVDDSSTNAHAALPAKMSLSNLVPLRRATSVVENNVQHSLKTSDFDDSDEDSTDSDSSTDDSPSSDSDSDSDDDNEEVQVSSRKGLKKPNPRAHLPLTIYVPASACLANKDDDKHRPKKYKNAIKKKKVLGEYRPEEENGGKKLINFVCDLLRNPIYEGKLLVKWENQEEGIFRILQSVEVARLWGMKKANPKMTYEKFSRAMRYYYATNILVTFEKHGYPKKLVYKFGPAFNWRNA